jgi:hypothetical protein
MSNNDTSVETIYIKDGIVKLVFENGDWIQMPTDMLKDVFSKETTL